MKFKILRIVAILICLIVIVYESISLYNDNKEYAIADTEYERLLNNNTGVSTTQTAAPTEDGETFPNLGVSYSTLEAINPDFVSWLYFPYFDISYPVVQEKEIDEYIKKTFDGTRNNAGCLFIDILSSPDFNGMHDIIFGHNMRNGSMFGKLKQLSQTEDRDAIKSNPFIYVYTEKAVYKYEIFAYYVTTVGSDAYSVVTTNEEYDDFLEYIQRNTIFQIPKDMNFAERPSILTLSTCSGQSGSGRRFVIHAAKVQTWETP